MNSCKVLAFLSAILLLSACAPAQQPAGRGNKVEDPAMLTDAEHELTDEDRRLQKSGEAQPLPEEPSAGDSDASLMMLSDQDEKEASTEKAGQAGKPDAIPEEPKAEKKRN